MVLISPILRLFRRTEGRACRVTSPPPGGSFAVNVLVAGSAVLVGLSSAPAYAVNFALNFQPDQAPGWTGATGSCTFASSICTANNLGNGDPTPFSETLQNVGGLTYFHVIVGDPASGFAQESYTRWAPGPNANLATNPSDITKGDFSPNSGGNETSVIDPNNTLNTSQPQPSFMDSAMNLGNPLSGQHVSGSGTGDPTKTVFRMVMTSASGDMSLEVVKPFLNKKPKISQTVDSGGMSSSFVADMTALSYSDKNTPGKIVNTMTLNTPDLPAGSSPNFDMSLAQHPDVTAGRYTFTSGAGWGPNPSLGWDQANSTFDPGTYSYFGGNGFDPLTFDWASNFHYNENALACSRPQVAGQTRNNAMGTPTGNSCPGHP